MGRSHVLAQHGGADRDAPYRLGSAPAGQLPPAPQDRENNAVAGVATSPSGRAIPPETHPPNGRGTAYHRWLILLAAPKLASHAGYNEAVINQTPGGYSSAYQGQEYPP